MRICFVSKECAGLRGGGIGTYIAEAGKALRAHGHEAWLVTPVYSERDRELIKELPFDRVVVTGEGLPSSERAHYFHAMPHYGYAQLVHDTMQALGESFDYIEFADYEAEAYICLQEQRLFGAYEGSVLGLVFHSPTWECFGYDKQEHRATLRIREICNIEEEAIRIAPVLNSPSRGLRDEVLTRLSIERDVAIIRYPMDLDEALPTPPKPRSALSDLDIIYYGRIEPRKGVEELVEAFKQLPECRITLIGGDVDYSPYGKSEREYLLKQAPENVIFHDPMPRPLLLERIKQADVCIFPSLFENWPNTCIEAMSAGRVVIGSQHGGMGEMIEDGVSGFHVDGRSADDIVRVFRERLAGSLSRLDEIGLAAAKRMRMLSDQERYCTDLTSRIESQRQTAAPLEPVAHESHKVTVVVPFYNDEETVGATIDAILGQTHRNLEVLIVNDGSPLANADDILQRQRDKDPRVRVVSKKNGGLGSARNFGIEESTGEFLLFCDADNLPRPEYAQCGVEILARNPDSHFIVPNVQHFKHGSGEPVGVYNPLPFDRKSCLLVNRFGDAGAFFRRSVFVDNGLRYDLIPTGYEDWALWMDLYALGLRGECVPRVLYDYRVRENSMIKIDSAPNHPTFVGWLIQHHLPDATQAERDLLTTIFQHAGQSIARVASGQPDGLPPAPPKPSPGPAASEPSAGSVGGASSSASPTGGVATRAVPSAESAPSGPLERPELTQLVSATASGPAPLRYKAVDEVSRISSKIPGFNWLLRGILGAGMGLGRKIRGR